MLSSRELVKNAVEFKGIDRLPHDFPEPFGSDFDGIGLSPSPDGRPSAKAGPERDEWGAVWENIGVCNLGEVKDFPLKDWADFDKLKIPDIRDPRRWQHLNRPREQAGNKFTMSSGISIYERVHFIRGLENTWVDIHTEPEALCRLIDILVDMNLYAIDKYAAAGADGYIFCDDWGLQDRLMIAPADWRRIWKPRYAKIYAAAHAAGMKTFLHSCGYIVDILEDFIEVGLDVIHMDQQANMGLELLGRRFGGRITFFAPVDIQQVMTKGNLAEIRAYAREMAQTLGRPNGGFIPRSYGDLQGAGHTQAALNCMCEEFLAISREKYDNP